MKTFVNKPGSPGADFNNFPIEEDAKEYRTLQHYLQALLRHYPNDVERLTKCPPGESENDWIYSSFRQFLLELNYYAYEHREVSTAANEPVMEFYVNGQKISCMSAAHQPPRAVPAIDYITQIIDSPTVIILDAKTFPGGVMTDQGRVSLETFARRLYRVFMYSYSCHLEIFERIEARSHICERFTKFGRLYSLLRQEDIHIPSEYWRQRAAKEAAAPST
jgi:hypothetical protein